MKNHYSKLIEKFELPDDAKSYLLKEAEKIFCSFMNEFENLIAQFYKVKNQSKLIDSKVKALSKKSDVNEYTLYFILIACSSYYMLSDYKRAKISEDIFWDTIRDLQYKAFECKAVKDVWGTFVPSWYKFFHNLDIFKLGRLEFQRNSYNLEKPYVLGDVTVKKGDLVYSIHIPSSGALTKELREDSYKKAYEFFKDELSGENIIFLCHSWLLYPKNKDIFPKNSNILDFMNDFDIIESTDDPLFYDAWRVFNKDYEKGKMETKTSLQKAIVNWIDSGNLTGEGYGIIVYKP